MIEIDWYQRQRISLCREIGVLSTEELHDQKEMQWDLIRGVCRLHVVTPKLRKAILNPKQILRWYTYKEELKRRMPEPENIPEMLGYDG
jgi:hypothetical protein